MDKCDVAEGHLIIFNRRVDVLWDEKIFQQEKSYQGQKIVVWGM